MKGKLRFIIQAIIFAWVGLVVFNHNYDGAISWLPEVSLHAICPFGAVETAYQLLFHNQYLAKLHESVVVMFGLILLMSVLFGPVFCSYICPLGSIQEWVGKLGRKIFKRRYNHFIPKGVDAALRYARYLVLLVVVYMTAKTMTLAFLSVDPFHALFNFYSTEVALGGLIVLVTVLIGSLFVERPWCKYLCPYGAMLGLTNKIRLFKIKRNPSGCIDCKQCDAVCPMNIEVSKQQVISSHQCISCHSCLSEEKCPVTEVVTISYGKDVK